MNSGNGRALVLAIAVLGAACSCSEDPSPGASTGGGAGGAGGATSTSTGASTGTGTGTGTETGWVPVEWSGPDCDVEMATEPASAVPPLTWVPCPSGKPGCEMVNVTWTHTFVGLGPLLEPAVAREPRGYWVGTQLVWESEFRSVIYGPAGDAVAVWRAAPASISGCSMLRPETNSEGYWFGAQSATALSRYFFQQYAELPGPVALLPLGSLAQRVVTDDDTFAIQLFGGDSIAVYDRQTGESYQHQGPDSGFVRAPHPAGDIAPFIRGALDKPEGWIWRRSDKAFVPLLQPPGATGVWDFKSDGTTMVWAEAGPPNDDGLPAGQLWKSPQVAVAAAVEPTLVAQLPPVFGYGPGATTIGGGYYATISGSEYPDVLLHVYRLSDGQHWAFQPEPELVYSFDVSYIDEDAVWYKSMQGVYRQSLAALGPGR